MAAVPPGRGAPAGACPLPLLEVLLLALLAPVLPAGAVVDVAEGGPPRGVFKLHLIILAKELPERLGRLVSKRRLILSALLLLGMPRALLLRLPLTLLRLVGLPLRLALLLLRLALLLLRLALLLLCLLRLLGLALLLLCLLVLRLCLALRAALLLLLRLLRLLLRLLRLLLCLLLLLGLLLRLSLCLLLRRIRRGLQQLAATLLGRAALLRDRRRRGGAGTNIRVAAQQGRQAGRSSEAGRGLASGAPTTEAWRSIGPQAWRALGAICMLAPATLAPTLGRCMHPGSAEQ